MLQLPLRYHNAISVEASVNISNTQGMSTAFFEKVFEDHQPDLTAEIFSRLFQASCG